MTTPTHGSYPRSPIPSSASYDSSVSSAASPQPQTAYGGGLMGASPRPLSGNMSHHPSMPRSSLGANAYSHNPYGSGPSSPVITNMDAIASNGSSAGMPGATAQMSNANLQAQKRAYRQRRKDPSCDACRERKVKCDATETTSCSECSSRNVKCQFTKETNRRMSSIKQVQDLEKQIAQVKRENAQLRSMLNNREGQMDVDSGTPVAGLQLPTFGSDPKRRERPPPPHELSRARKNLRTYGRRIFKPPAPYQQTGTQPHFNPPRPELPPKHVSDHLLNSYYASVHTAMPILHWPTFKKEYEDVYRIGNLNDVPSVWLALLFAVLAVGVVYSTDSTVSTHRKHTGKGYIETSRSLTDMWNDEFVIDHARCALLTSVFLSEMNMKSAAWVWLASAVRIAQDVGLHSETGPWPIIEGEMRRRVWWGIYVWDRLISLELARPLLIEDADCDVSLPNAVDDYHIHESGIMIPHGAMHQQLQPSNFLLPSIHVVRSISQLIKTLKSTIIAPGTLATFETHFKTCLSAFPSACHFDSREPLEPRMLAPISYLMNARIILHRHNLSTSSPADTRTAALEHCVQAALDTASLLGRAIKPRSPASQHIHPGVLNAEFGLTASTLLCTHIWRCTLFLVFSGHYNEALKLIHASAAIGTYRSVNIACGRYLTFFLQQLLDRRHHLKIQSGRPGTRPSLLDDEELIAYVSGDLQASTENSWVWQGSETGINLKSAAEQRASGPGTSPLSQEFTLDDDDERGWNGWERVEYLVGIMIRESGASGMGGGPSMAQYPPEQQMSGYGMAYSSSGPGPMNKAVTGSFHQMQLQPPSSAPPSQQPLPSSSKPGGSGSDRISIANII